MVANLNSVFQNLDDNASPIELLMVGCSPGDANQCANELRNRGQAVHIKQVQGLTELERLLETEPGDLVVINTDADTLNLSLAVDVLRESNPGSAIILYGSNAPNRVDFVTEHNLRDLIPADETAHLAFAIKREYQSLLLRQEMSKLRHRLQEAERRFDDLLGTSRDAVAYVHEGMLIHANEAYRQMFGIESAEDLEGVTLMDLTDPDTRQDFKKVLRSLSDNKSFSTQVSCVGNDGRRFTSLMEFNPAEFEGETCTQIIIRDDSLNEELQARIDQLTVCDPQTGLYNRQAFMERLEESLTSGRMQPGGGLIQIKVRNLAAICNDVGLDKSDHLLQTIAEILKQQTREGDTLARLGERDFVALVERPEGLEKLGDRYLQALNAQDFAGSDQVLVPVEFSIGVMPHPKEKVSAHELISRSCHVTGLAEAGEANQVMVYTEETNQPSTDELDPALLHAIDTALENDRFRLYYQPIVSLQGDTHETYAIFLRMLDERGQDHPLEDFWSHAKRGGRLADIDRWVIRNAIRKLAEYRTQGQKINFEMVLSQAGFSDESMLLWICDCLREFKAKGSWLTFKMKQNDLRECLEPARRLAEGLKKINCRVAIGQYDDEPASRTLLTHFPIDVVKLSPGFMDSLTSNALKQEQLSEVNGRLQAAGLKTVACQVEDASTLAILWNVGVNYAQGSFLQEPSSSIAIEQS